MRRSTRLNPLKILLHVAEHRNELLSGGLKPLPAPCCYDIPSLLPTTRVFPYPAVFAHRFQHRVNSARAGPGALPPFQFLPKVFSRHASLAHEPEHIEGEKTPHVAALSHGKAKAAFAVYKPFLCGAVGYIVQPICLNMRPHLHIGQTILRLWRTGKNGHALGKRDKRSE